MKMLAGLVLAVFLTMTTWRIGALRHRMGQTSGTFLSAMHGQVAGNPNGEIWVLLTLIVPTAVAYMMHQTSQIRAEHAKAAVLQRAWDAEQNARLELRERREALLRMAREEKARLEAKREEARARIRALQQRAHNAEKALRDRVELERRYGVAFIRSVIAALEQDRFYFIKAARSQNALHLLNVPGGTVEIHSHENIKLLPPPR